MTIPTSAVDICNLALDHLGQGSIENIESPTTTAEQTCARWYDHVRQVLLREYVWNFAKRRAVISRTGTPVFDWSDQYQLPNDCVRILSINGDSEILQEQDYDIEDRNILLNNDGATSAKLRYIADVTDVQKWDPLFRNLMALELAMRISYKFTLKKGLVDQLSQLLALDLPKAVTVDGQERPPRRIQRSQYLAARKTGSSSNVASQYTDFDS